MSVAVALEVGLEAETAVEAQEGGRESAAESAAAVHQAVEREAAGSVAADLEASGSSHTWPGTDASLGLEWPHHTRCTGKRPLGWRSLPRG